MNKIIQIGLAAALLMLPLNAQAQGAAPKIATAGVCPAASEMDALQKGLDDLTQEMAGIADTVADAPLKARMQKMQEHLALITLRARKLHDEMQGGAAGMMVKAEKPATQMK